MYDLPHFTPSQRQHFFSLDPQEKQIFDQLKRERSKALFVLQAGYFKARQQFYLFSDEEVSQDVAHIFENYFGNQKPLSLKVTDQTLYGQQSRILKIHNFRLADSNARQTLLEQASAVCRVSSQPVYVFRQLLHYLESHRIVLPGYTTMQDIVGKAVHLEQRRITLLLGNFLGKSDSLALNLLLNSDQDLHEITQLRKEPKNFTIGEIADEVRKKQQTERLYDLAQAILPKLAISNESIKYY